MSYLSDKLGTIGKIINHVAGPVNSMTGILPSGLRVKVEQCPGRGTTSNNLEYTVD
jgi:hypothetical protein